MAGRVSLIQRLSILGEQSLLVRLSGIERIGSALLKGVGRLVSVRMVVEVGRFGELRWRWRCAKVDLWLLRQTVRR